MNDCLYAGRQRIVSKVGDVSSYGSDPRTLPVAGGAATAGITVDYQAKNNPYAAAAGIGYNAGYFIEDIGQWLTQNPNFRIRYNPYTKDFTPIEVTLQKYDELGIYLY